MKTCKAITVAAVMLAILILILASFYGVYVLKIFKVSNIIPEYNLGMEFSNRIVADYEVDTSVKATKVYDANGTLIEQEDGVEYTAENGYTTVDEMTNDESVLTAENYKKAKNIFKNKLYSLGATQYTIKLDEETGKITVELPENDDSEYILNNLGQTGTFALIDYETEEVLLNEENLEMTNVNYGAGQELNETTVYLYLQFDEEGAEKLKEITSTYVEGETEEESKYVTLLFNGQPYLEKTTFSEQYSDGKLYLTFGSSSDQDTLQQYIENAAEIATNLNSGVNPIVYTYTSEIKETNVSETVISIASYVFIALNIISFIYLVVKFKRAGLMASVLQVGYIATLLLVLRALNITITLEGIIGIIISVILNYIFMNIAFNSIFIERRTMKESMKEIFAKFTLRTIPVYIIAVIFTFTGLLYTSSLGMAIVWGAMVVYIYNIIFTNILLRVAVKED